MSDSTATDLFIGAALRGETITWDGVQGAKLIELRGRVALHGVHALLYESAAARNAPDAVREWLRNRSLQFAMWELRHQQVLGDVLRALDSADIHPVLIKGTALAYSLYADPTVRERGDTDLIIPLDAKDLVHDQLLALGFVRHAGVSGEFVSYQSNYTLTSADGSSHTLDLHWKISNSEVLSRLFTYEELHASAMKLPRLSPHALGTSRVHALLLACMHRCTHKQSPYYVDDHPHHDPDRLIWLLDLHLLSQAFTGGEWNDFVAMARRKGLCHVSAEGLERAQAHFHTVVPQRVLSMLRSGTPALPARYLEAGKLRRQWMNFVALESFGARARYVRELFFPPVRYMQAKYQDSSVRWLPWLYVRRAAGGASKALAARRPAS